MIFLFRVFVVAVAAFAAAPSFAQKKVKTETIREPEQKAQKLPEIIRDFSRLPEPVQKMHTQILAAARSGDLDKVAAIMKAAPTPTSFSFGGDQDPVAFWKSAFPDSDGVEAMSILIEVLESPFVHSDKGTKQEMFVWPYFQAMPLDKLSPEQRVELFKLVTAADYKAMQDFGAYNFYRVGISPDGNWQFFVAGD